MRAETLEYVWHGSDWRPYPLVEIGAITPGTGWTIYSGHMDQLSKCQGVARLHVTLVSSVGVSLNDLCTLPAGFRPSIATFGGYTQQSGQGFHGDVYVNSDGKIMVPYYSGTVYASQYLPLALSWPV